MARQRLKMLPVNLIALVSLMVWGTGVHASDSPSPPPASPSPSADIELICHTDNPAECYPKVFQATNEFQIVKPDQDLPIGLHVRLNVQTGQKEAKIYNPEEEDDPALAGLPVESSVVVVDGQSEEPNEELPIPPKAPKYSSEGKIKPPSPGSGSSGSAAADPSQFLTSLTILKKGLDPDGALDMLSDISHDIYYGLKIAEDYETVRTLFCLANTDLIFSSSSTSQSNDKTISRARLAALTIASSIQNNPTALKEIESHWPKLSNEWCPNTSSELGRAIFRLVVPPFASSSSSSTQQHQRADPSLTKARISAISHLLKSDTIRKQFLSVGGMDRLLEVLLVVVEPHQNDKTRDEKTKEWEPAQRKVGLLAIDNFLDADMGAKLGEWPTGPQASAQVCAAAAAASNAKTTDESATTTTTETAGLAECWDYHAQKFAARYKKDKSHWSHDLVKKLAEQRKINNSNEKKKEKENHKKKKNIKTANTTNAKGGNGKKAQNGGRGKDEL